MKPLDVDFRNALCRIPLSHADAAAVLGVTVATLDRAIAGKPLRTDTAERLRAGYAALPPVPVPSDVLAVHDWRVGVHERLGHGWGRVEDVGAPAHETLH